MERIEHLGEYDITGADTIVFVHLPKTAGITLGTMIDPMWLPEARCPLYDMRDLAQGTWDELAQYKSFLGHYHLRAIERLVQRPFVRMTMLREPIGRYISEFHFVQRQRLKVGQKPHPESATVRSIALEDFVVRPDLRRHRMMIDLQSRWLSMPYHAGSIPELNREWRQVTEHPTPVDTGEVLETLNRFDCFGLTEHFQESLWMMCYTFGWYPLENRLALNQSPRSTSPDSVGPETLAHIYDFNRADLTLYAFAKELFQIRLEWLMHTLLERYATRQEAGATLPLPPEMMHRLLERHFEARVKARSPKTASPVSFFSFERTAESAAGWQGRELSQAHGWYRWTGPGQTSSLDLTCPETTQDLELHFSVMHVVNPALLDLIRVSVNDVPVQWTRELDADGTMHYRAPIPTGTARFKSYLHIEWSVPGTFRPVDMETSNTDERRLGIAITWVKLAPLPIPEPSAPEHALALS